MRENNKGGKAFRFVRKVRRRMTCLYVPPYAPLLRKGARGNVKTIPTPVTTAAVVGGWW